MAYCTGASVSTADDRCSEHSTPSRQRSRAFEATTLDPTDEAMEWSVLEESCRSAFTSDETAMSPVSGLESELTSAALALEPMPPPGAPGAHRCGTALVAAAETELGNARTALRQVHSEPLGPCHLSEVSASTRLENEHAVEKVAE